MNMQSYKPTHILEARAEFKAIKDFERQNKIGAIVLSILFIVFVIAKLNGLTY